MRNISAFIEANGLLEVPPQNEAEVTAIVGANVKSINVIEGEKVKKGQVLAYLTHPVLIQMQTDYLTNWNELEFLKLEYERSEKLYSEKIGSDKDLQKIKSEFYAKEVKVKGLAAQLGLLGLSTDRLKNNTLYNQVPVKSPLNGYIRMVEIKIGQYVKPEKSMFEVVNVEHVHADLMVFEKDVHKVKEGQKMTFLVESLPNQELEAVIYSVGKAFEQDPKAVHVHAEIENKAGLLIPGMYVKGNVLVDNNLSHAMPEDGIVRHGDKYYIFTAKQEEDHHGEKKWVFKPIEVLVGNESNGWVEVILLNPLVEGTKVAWNNAYNLMAEIKKEEAEHSH